MIFKADPDERLLSPPSSSGLARQRGFLLLVVICLVIHAGLIAVLLYRDQSAPSESLREEEIPVEVVIEPPPEPEPPPPPQQQQKEKPPKIKVQDDEKPAFDAPRTVNQETVERDAPDKETQSPRVAPMTKQTAEKPAPEKKPEATPQEAAAQPAPQTEPQKLADDKPDAEALDKAAPEPPTRPQDKPKEKKTLAETKTPPAQAKRQTVADQLAALNSLPDFKVGSLAKPAPVAGGTERTTYLSILFGLIMRQMHFPPGLRERHIMGEGIISFYVDEVGHLTHQAVYRSSGLPDLDAAALNAVRRAAPFPAPPRGDPHAIWFHFDTR